MFIDSQRVGSTILIVDDVAANISQLHEAVKDLGQVMFATDGQRALQLARAHMPEVVLLDIEMPGMDGYAVCSALKSDPLTADCSVIFVTGHSSSLHELPALRTGGVDFLHKPLNFPVVHARVHTQLQLKRQSRQIMQVQRDLSDLVHNLPAFVSYWDREGRNRFSNDTTGQWFGIQANQMVGMALADVVGAKAHGLMALHVDAVLSGGKPHFELGLEIRGGEIRHVQGALVGTERDGGAGGGFLMLLTDITRRKLAEQALFEEKERIRVMLSSIGDSVVATDAQGLVTFLNPIAEHQTGWTNKFALGQPIETIMRLRDASTGADVQNPIRLALKECRTVGMALNTVLVGQDNREYVVEDSASPIRDAEGRLVGAIIVFHDVSEARAMAIKMSHLANHDALTDLPNRILLHDRIDQALQHARRSGNYVALMMVDLDKFKMVNDSAGFRVGDELLQQLAVRLKNSMRVSDTISRQGGDEFIILLPDLETVEHLGGFAQKMLALVNQPFMVAGHRHDLSASIGISIFPADADDQEALMRHADSAIFRAKKLGRGRYQFYSSEFEARLLARHQLEKEMREALERGGFEVFYQPKVRLPENKIVGVEALVRMRRMGGELVPPSDFIPLSEETGLIIPMGQFVLKQACIDACSWHAKGFDGKVCVNISAVQFSDEHFPAMVNRALAETGIRPELLELEITEGVLMHDFTEVRQTLLTLAGMGIKLAIDDFGTGYSSLAYLKRFPVDVLKIDQSFVRDMLVDKSDAAIIAAIINLGRSLGIGLVAEGVETAEQADALLQMGCHVMQGYHYSRPVTCDAMSAMLLRN